VNTRKNLISIMQSEEQKGDKHEDTGIGLTFASKRDVTEPDKEREIPRST